ncbi:hypothetical protein H0H93_008332 [Arthromyces matolae]|nr:hypothetical protein H0H93_008332 [Arthromyces matolae]
MAIAKLLNLLALSSIAILAFSYGAAPVTALSVDAHHLAARSSSHALLAKKKRSLSKRCKQRPAPSAVSSSSSSSSSSAHPTSTKKPATTSVKASSTHAAASANTQAAAVVAGNTGDNGGSAKVGLGWPQDDDTALAHFKTDNVGPVYTWSPWVPDAAKSLGLHGVPMLWGEKQIADFVKIVKKGYANAVLGFNEPNQQGQSDMSPEYGAQLWKQYIQPLQSQGYSLISPAPTNAASGVTWLQSFFTACDGCHFDGIAVHWYGTDPQAFISYMEHIHTTFGKPIWVTEYACQNFGSGAQCSSDDVWNFMTVTKNWMDATDYIAHYFYFGAMYDMGNVNQLNQLMSSNGYPNALGKFYIS